MFFSDRVLKPLFGSFVVVLPLVYVTIVHDCTNNSKREAYGTSGHHRKKNRKEVYIFNPTPIVLFYSSSYYSMP